ncbi:uncharacterized protein LOC131598080 [Vicia villosa]|uniref:uncharacterized protein LOC131598080 n=1 Tax=Vicia villosa TaxID=3911 RepID=UPI00273C83A5|nr:uncharacterized protein LOC131598080 [Vicia villosa]
MRQATQRGLYKGFKIKEVVEYSLLQFADDTILFGDGSWHNLWTLKAMLRGFEMVSGLSLNLKKSKLYGVGIDDYRMGAAASFLGCKIERIPFKFLGLTVGGNHRRLDFWKPVVNSMRQKLSSWKGKLVSIGGRVTMINSIISNLPSYQFSFFKIPKKVAKEIIAIQRNFLWSGVGKKNRLRG